MNRRGFIKGLTSNIFTFGVITPYFGSRRIIHDKPKIVEIEQFTINQSFNHLSEGFNSSIIVFSGYDQYNRKYELTANNAYINHIGGNEFTVSADHMMIQEVKFRV
jgi:hypothetical protein